MENCIELMRNIATEDILLLSSSGAKGHFITQIHLPKQKDKVLLNCAYLESAKAIRLNVRSNMNSLKFNLIF